MSATGYTPILIYGSTTTGNTPSASNLTTTTNGVELAINATDGKLFYKDNNGVVQVLATKAGTSGIFTNVTITGGTIDGTTIGATTPSSGKFSTLTATTSNLGTVSTGTWNGSTIGTGYGGTGITTTPANGALLIGNGTGYTSATLTAGTGIAITNSSGGITIAVNGTGEVTSFQTSLSGLTPSTATAGAVTLAGTLGTSSGGTGLTAFTANQIFYASSTSAIAQSSNLTFNGTTLTANTLNLTNALGVAYGGTGLTTLTSGYIPYGNGTSAFSSSSSLTFDGQTLLVNRSTPILTLTDTSSSNNSLRFVSTGGINYIQSGISGGSFADLTFTSNNGSSEKMRLTSAGYLGIGTNSPATQLQITGSFSLGNGQNIGWGGAYGAGVPTIAGSSGSGILFYANGSTSGLTTTFDASGNLGLGVTPSVWYSQYKAMQFSGGLVLASFSSGGAYVGSNYYSNSSGVNTYISSSYATSYGQSTTGQHQWFTAPSGTAGNAITFTQAMTLTNSGYLGVGGTSPFAKISSYVSSSGTFQSALGATNSVDSDLTIRIKTSVTDLYNSAGALTFTTSNGENMRITSGGQVLLNLSSAPSTNNQIPLVVSTAGAPLIKFYSNNSASMAATCGITTQTYGASKYSGYQLTSNGTGMFTNSSAGTTNYISGAGSIVFGSLNQDPFENSSATFTESARFTSGGYLGIGTSSPSNILTVQGNSGQVRVSNGTDTADFGTSGSTAYLGSNTNVPLYFYTNGTERMRLDTSGNLGLGVTPSAWSGFGSAEEYGGKGNFVGGNSSALYVGNNAYYNSGWKYVNSAAAGYYYSYAGQHTWYNAPSGTAGNAITFTQAMTLDNSGNLLVGKTTSSNYGDGSQIYPAGTIGLGHPSGTGSGAAYALFGYNATGIGSITQSGTTAVLYNTTSDQRLKENIVDAPQGNIDQIKVRSFDWIADGSHQEYGVVAQELLEVAPYAVHQPQDTNEMMGVDYSKLVPMMIREIQDLRARLAKAGL